MDSQRIARSPPKCRGCRAFPLHILRDLRSSTIAAALLAVHLPEDDLKPHFDVILCEPSKAVLERAGFRAIAERKTFTKPIGVSIGQGKNSQIHRIPVITESLDPGVGHAPGQFSHANAGRPLSRSRLELRATPTPRIHNSA